ncbi:transposase InsO family protein [Bradyrhizobium sp. USDA 4473]
MPANLLDRQCAAERSNQKWIADFTYLWTAEGWLYVAAVIDLFSRRVVGWSMSAAMTALLVTDALLMAVWRRGKPDALLHHSDQGSQGGQGLRRQQPASASRRHAGQSRHSLTTSRSQPIPYDKRLYRQRNLIERMFARLKDFRRIATRYDKLARNFLSVAFIAAAVVWWLN